MNYEGKNWRSALRETSNQAGQSMVLIALLIVLLLGFAGLAADVGMLFARSSQFSAAVDAATLAGVVDLPGSLGAAQQRAEQFLDANGWPISEAVSSNATQNTTALGYPQLNYTVTYPVDTTFLSLLGFGEIPITHAASAAIYSWADMPTATQAEVGILRMAGQYIYGPESCTAQGDPVSAQWRAHDLPNPLHTETGGKYTYRIRIPGDFGSDLEVQLFDPDSLNARPDPSATVYPRDGSAPFTQSCPTSGNGDTCLIPTDEGTDLRFNPVWLHRVDETWQVSTGTCPQPRVNDPNGDTVTRYDLYHLDDDANRVDIAVFQTGNGIDQQTDMMWVTPGDPNVLPGEPTVPTVMGSFLIDDDVIDDLPQDDDGYRSVYLDVTAVAGSSKNGWDVWAGPPSNIAAAQDVGDNDKTGDGIVDGNERNLYILDNLDTFTSDGVEIFALGYLPTYSYFGAPNLPVASIDQSLGGITLTVSVFDLEDPSGSTFLFNLSSVIADDWEETRSASCSGSADCNNKWVDPAFSLTMPGQDTDVAFYGGYLTANYAMNNDEQVWTTTLPLGRPFLTR